MGGGDVNVRKVAAIHIPDAEKVRNEGETTFTFIRDLKDEEGKRVFPGLYVIFVLFIWLKIHLTSG
ncbi:MAG: hypothetical protein LLG37_01195 [Spirochaetia bacterium]|nr:hypothetical protein [Spirochaetia bacterium]